MAPALPGFGRRFGPVWLAGLVGVSALLLQPVPPAVLQAMAGAGLPEPAVRLLLLANPLLLLTLAALAGAGVAHRVGFTSWLAGTHRGPVAWRAPAAAGVALGLALALADIAGARLAGGTWQAFIAPQADAPVLLPLLFGVLYGGLAEEVMLRWGVMALLAWLLARASGRWRRDPAAGLPAWVAWTAIVLASLLFAAGHLPALAQLAEPSPALVARTLALNAVGGLLYGWFFWRRGLEAAMVAHAGTHLGLAAVRLWV